MEENGQLETGYFCFLLSKFLLLIFHFQLNSFRGGKDLVTDFLWDESGER